MKNKVSSIVVLILVLYLASCSDKVLYTKQMQQKLFLNEINLGSVQFYNSKKIVLKRNLDLDDAKVSHGKINFINGQYVEEIIIDKNTPGVAVRNGKNFLDIAFEKDKKGYFTFILNPDNYFQLSAKTWENNLGKITYDTLNYYIMPGGAKALLKVSKHNINGFKKKTRKLKGIIIEH